MRPSGLVHALDVEDGRGFAFVFDGRVWAAVTLGLAVLLGALTRSDEVVKQPYALWFFRVMAALMLVGFVRNLGSRVTIEVERSSGRVTCSGKWSWGRIDWTKAAEEFRELRVTRGSVDGGRAANMYLELVDRDGTALLLRTRGFAESTRHAAVLGLAKRVAEAVRVPLSDHS